MYRVIFENSPKAGMDAEFIAAWLAGSDIIQTYPGALGTKLFTEPSKPGVYFAMADWERREDRDAAFAAIKRDRPDAEQVLNHFKTFLENHKEIGEHDGKYDLVARSDPK